MTEWLVIQHESCEIWAEDRIINSELVQIFPKFDLDLNSSPNVVVVSGS